MNQNSNINDDSNYSKDTNKDFSSWVVNMKGL